MKKHPQNMVVMHEGPMPPKKHPAGMPPKKMPMMKRKGGGTLERIGHEMKVNPPKILAHTAEKFGKDRAEKQRVAILLAKARRRGAKVKGKGRKRK